MHYTEVRFPAKETAAKEALIALLDHESVTGFEETAEEVICYFSRTADIQLIREIAAQLETSYKMTVLQEKNWNEEWESNFKPIILDDYCYIRADFHPEYPGVTHEIIITPKMSFGTGHHATTLQMIGLMRNLDMTGKAVLDFGTGTGILAILAYKCGASVVYGIDNDEWAFKNALENCERNNATAIRIEQASIEAVPDTEMFDIILANINRHILLDTMGSMAKHLNNGGQLLLSGILENEDVAMVRACAEKHSLAFEMLSSKDRWAAMQFRK